MVSSLTNSSANFSAASSFNSLITNKDKSFDSISITSLRTFSIYCFVVFNSDLFSALASISASIASCFAFASASSIAR